MIIENKIIKKIRIKNLSTELIKKGVRIDDEFIVNSVSGDKEKTCYITNGKKGISYPFVVFYDDYQVVDYIDVYLHKNFDVVYTPSNFKQRVFTFSDGVIVQEFADNTYNCSSNDMSYINLVKKYSIDQRHMLIEFLTQNFSNEKKEIDSIESALMQLSAENNFKNKVSKKDKILMYELIVKLYEFACSSEKFKEYIGYIELYKF